MIKIKKIIKSFRHAIRGLREAFWGGQNFRIMVYAVLASILVLGTRPIPTEYKIGLILASALLLIVEIVNTAIEKAMDLLLPASLDEIRHIKDIMAGAALVASVCWVISVFLAFTA